MAEDMSKHYRVIQSPLISEKAVTPRGPRERDEKGKATGEPRQVYAFYVERLANKIEIKDAIEKIFKVKVDKVRTLVTKDRDRRVRYFQVRGAMRKKAYVTLAEGHVLNFSS